MNVNGSLRFLVGYSILSARFLSFSSSPSFLWSWLGPFRWLVLSSWSWFQSYPVMDRAWNKGLYDLLILNGPSPWDYQTPGIPFKWATTKVRWLVNQTWFPLNVFHNVVMPLTGSYLFPTHDMVLGELETCVYTMDGDDASTAKAVVRHEYECVYNVSKVNRQKIFIATECSMSGNADHFFIESKLHVRLNGETFFERVYTNQIERQSVWSFSTYAFVRQISVAYPPSSM